MRLSKIILAAVAVAVPALAGTINVTNAGSLEVGSGDELRFNFQAWNFAQYTQGSLPSRVSFMFSVLPLGGTAPQFQAWLENGDQSYLVSFDNPVTVGTGAMKSQYYQGSVNAFSDSQSFSSAAANALFGANGTATATLVLRDLGGSANLQLPGYSIAQAMTISLSNGTVGMGAVRGAVYLEQVALGLVPAVGGAFAALPTPEPGAFTLAGLGLALTLAGGIRKKLL